MERKEESISVSDACMGVGRYGYSDESSILSERSRHVNAER